MDFLSMYVMGGFGTSIWSGYVSTYSDLNKSDDPGKLSTVPGVATVQDLHADNWKVVRLVHLRHEINVQHRRLKRLLLPSFAVVCGTSAVTVLIGVVVANMTGKGVSVFGVPPDDFGHWLMKGGATLLYFFVGYFRTRIFVLNRSVAILESVV